MVEATELGIRGARLVSRKIIRDERGSVMHGLRADEGLGHVGEVYFSTVNPGAVKAWHLHRRMTLRYLCVYGRVMVVLVDLREVAQPLVAAVLLSPSDEEYHMLVVPPGVWNGYRSMTDSISTICNIADLEYDPAEIVRVTPEEAFWKFNWGPYERAG